VAHEALAAVGEEDPNHPVGVPRPGALGAGGGGVGMATGIRGSGTQSGVMRTHCMGCMLVCFWVYSNVIFFRIANRNATKR